MYGGLYRYAGSRGTFPQCGLDPQGLSVAPWSLAFPFVQDAVAVMPEASAFSFIRRHANVLTGGTRLEPVFSLPDFPVYMGCTDRPAAEDVRADLRFSICRDTGLIQLDAIPPAALLYQLPHNDGTGGVWRRHHQELAVLIAELLAPGARVLEVGGATGTLAGLVTAARDDVDWTLIDPNPVLPAGTTVKSVRGFFAGPVTAGDGYDAVIHSHVIEHVFDPPAFLAQLAACAKPGGLHVFSLPDLAAMLARGYTNCLNFEHTLFLAEAYVDVLLARAGFVVEDKRRFGTAHSLFYVTRLSGGGNREVAFPDLYAEHRRLMTGFRATLDAAVARANRMMADLRGPVYLFGAHIFSQYLIGAGLETGRVAGVLDNSPLKIGHRLYGTPFTVFHPEVVAGQSDVAVVLKVEQYRDEIVGQLQGLNPAVTLIE